MELNKVRGLDYVSIDEVKPNNKLNLIDSIVEMQY